jgi:hypothetical protein
MDEKLVDLLTVFSADGRQSILRAIDRTFKPLKKIGNRAVISYMIATRREVHDELKAVERALRLCKQYVSSSKSGYPNVFQTIWIRLEGVRRC